MLTLWRNNLQKLNGLWDMDITLQNGGCSISLDPVDWSAQKVHQVGAFWTYFTGLLSSRYKKCPLGEVLVLISQQGPEILSSLCFVMLCPYLRGHWTFGGYFFTEWVLLHRHFNIWCHLGQKCLFRGLASMEVMQNLAIIGPQVPE